MLFISFNKQFNRFSLYYVFCCFNELIIWSKSNKILTEIVGILFKNANFQFILYINSAFKLVYIVGVYSHIKYSQNY